MAISSHFNDSFCVFRFSCCSSCVWHRQYSKHVSWSEELVLVNNWMPIQEKEEHECFSEATLLFYNGQPAPHNHSHSDGNMEVGGLQQAHCTCLKLHLFKWSTLVQVGQLGGEIWGWMGVQRSCGQGGGSLVNLCMMSRFISPSKRSQQCGLMPMFCITSLLPSRPHFLRDRALSLLGIFIMLHLASLHW